MGQSRIINGIKITHKSRQRKRGKRSAAQRERHRKEKQPSESCSAFGCTEQFKIESNIRFFKFPRNQFRRDLWIRAIKRMNWSPSFTSVLCSRHFQTGKPSQRPSHPDYVPNIFVVSDSFEKPESHSATAQIEESQCVIQDSIKIEDMPVNTESLFLSADTSEAVIAGIKNEVLDIETEPEQQTTETDVIKKKIDEPLIFDTTEIVFESSITDKEEELSKLKKELEQANKKINELQLEKNVLQNFITYNVTDRILVHTWKLRFFTGLNSIKDFHSIAKLLHDADATVASVPVLSQLLIVLMRLQLNLKYPDLADRFQISVNTVRKICESVIPHLESKLKLLLEGLSPVSTGMQPRVSRCYTNTVFVKLHQTIQRYIKSKRKTCDNDEFENYVYN